MCAVSYSTETTDIKTLLKLALPIGSRLIIGNPDTPVSWVCHLRTRMPIFADIEGGELVLVSTNTLANYQKPRTLESLIEELAKTNASALGVRGTLTPRAHQVAKHYGFPLVALPDRAVLPQTERAIQRFFTNRQAQLAHRAFELQQTLQRHATSYRGMTTMLNALARMLDRPVVMHDREGNLISRGLPVAREKDWSAHPALGSRAEFARRFVRQYSTFSDEDWQVVESPVGLTAPLIHENRLLGCVSVLDAHENLDEFDLLTLEYSVPTLTRELVRQQSVDLGFDTSTPGRDWISDWLSSPTADEALLTLRAEKDHYRVSTWYSVVLFHWTPTSDRLGSIFTPERMVKTIQGELHQRRIEAPVGQYVDRAVLLFPLDEPQQTQRLKQMVELLQGALQQAAPGGHVYAGVGRPVMGFKALRESFDEAGRALTMSEQVWADSPVAFFGDVSLYELLMGVNDANMLAGFYNHWLSPLVDYDTQHNTDLLDTLDAYFANNGNMARTAHILNIHRNTLVYRLGRISEIIELDMDDPNVRLNLHLALKIQTLVSARQQQDLGFD